MDFRYLCLLVPKQRSLNILKVTLLWPSMGPDFARCARHALGVGRSLALTCFLLPLLKGLNPLLPPPPPEGGGGSEADAARGAAAENRAVRTALHLIGRQTCPQCNFDGPLMHGLGMGSDI